MSTTAQVQGVCDARFANVRDAFAENLDKRGDVGGSGLRLRRRQGGRRSLGRLRRCRPGTAVDPWHHQLSRFHYKGMTALCAHMLVERGFLDLDAPVARYWPEFARGGKANVPVRWLLSHRAGLPAVRQDMAGRSLFDWNAFTTALAETDPWWEPGTRHGYHALTYGYLVGEVIRRVSGKTVGQFFHAEVAGPLDADFYIGVPASEDARAAEMLAPPRPFSGEPTRMELLAQSPTSMAARAFLNPPRSTDVVNTRAWRAAEIPSSNGHTTARAVARIYGALACGGTLDGIRLLSATTIDAAIVEQSRGVDAILELPSRFGLGFLLPLREHFHEAGLGLQPFGPNARAFGHWGMGGSVGFADPDGRVGFGYVMNQSLTGTPGNPDVRWPSLVEPVYAGLG
jgi:CubicO group peptidase (beta-lactamase class C family)